MSKVKERVRLTPRESRQFIGSIPLRGNVIHIKSLSTKNRQVVYAYQLDSTDKHTITT